jgi:hypothetical protein
MGLDITAYRRVEEVPSPELDADDFPVDWKCQTRFLDNTDFPGRFEGLKAEAIYAFADSFDFRAGSYSGYGWWREQLAALAGYSTEDAWNGRADGKPFIELVNFADNEGTLGPAVCARLAKDFADFDDRAKAHSPETWFYESYCNWRKAFEMGADRGAVDFH